MKERTIRFADLEQELVDGLNRNASKLAICVKDFKVALIKRVYNDEIGTHIVADFYDDTIHLCKEGVSFGLCTNIENDRLVDDYKEVEV